MRSFELSLEKYDSDKIDSHYLEKYDPIFEPYLNEKINLLELGVLKGGSLLLWRDYFRFGNIVGIDIKLPKNFNATERINVFEGSQTDTKFLTQVATQTAPEGFDIIIDDASHIGELTKTSFWHLFDNHLKPGGFYIIEDWGTGYWEDWPDGKNFRLDKYHQSKFVQKSFWLYWTKIKSKVGLKSSMKGHNFGMVGFIKQLIDEQGAHDITRTRIRGKPKRNSKFEFIKITSSIVFVKKISGYISDSRKL